MDKKPDSTPPVATKAGVVSDSSTPKAMPMPAYSPVGGQVPRVAVPMPSADPGGVPALPARHNGPKTVGATAGVMRMDGYPAGCGGMQARPIVGVEAALPARMTPISPIGHQPSAMPTTGG